MSNVANLANVAKITRKCSVCRERQTEKAEDEVCGSCAAAYERIYGTNPNEALTMKTTTKKAEKGGSSKVADLRAAREKKAAKVVKVGPVAQATFAAAEDAMTEAETLKPETTTVDGKVRRVHRVEAPADHAPAAKPAAAAEPKAPRIYSARKARKKLAAIVAQIETFQKHFPGAPGMNAAKHMVEAAAKEIPDGPAARKGPAAAFATGDLVVLAPHHAKRYEGVLAAERYSVVAVVGKLVRLVAGDGEKLLLPRAHFVKEASS